MPMYNLVEYSNNYTKTSGSLCQYNKGVLTDNISAFEPFKIKARITEKPPTVGKAKDVETVVPSKHLSNFWLTLEIPLINFEVSLQPTWLENCVITDSTCTGTFEITDTKLRVPVVTLSTQDNTKLPEPLKSEIKRTINWNKQQPKVSV